MAHEDLQREDEFEGSSDRNFGLVFAGFFGILAIYQWFRHGVLHGWFIGAAAVFLLLALVYPTSLRVLNRLWGKLGLLMGKVVSPIALGLLFYGVVLPTGLAMRFFGNDPLRLRYDKAATTYWIERTPPGPEPESLKQQF